MPFLPQPLRNPAGFGLLAFLAAAPDLDVIGFSFDIPYSHPLGHRGLSHSVFFAAALAAASWPLWRHRLSSGATRAAVVCFVAIASHGLLDTLTDGGLGIGLWIPLDDGRYFAPWRPIEVSPLSVDAFLSHRGLAILANEARWVGLPCLAFTASVWAWRRYLPRPRRSP